MPREYGRTDCWACGKNFLRLSFKQLLCGKRDCLNKRKRLLESARRKKERKKNPRPCEMCEKPLPKGKVKYHPKCRKKKERLRLKIYYLKTKKVHVLKSRGRGRRPSSL